MKPKRAVSTLLQKDLPSSPKICTIQPLEVYHHATFLVDLEALPSAQDIKCDDVGNWRNNSNDKFYFTLEAMDDNSTRVIAAESSDTDVATLKREYYMLKHDNDFRKRIDFLSMPGGQLHRYCLVQSRVAENIPFRKCPMEILRRKRHPMFEPGKAQKTS